MEGEDVAHALRKDRRTAHIPVVALTALRYPDGGARLLADAFSGYLEKPIDVDTFAEQVSEYCRRPSA
jgi:CheY-like chemotaxis protein